jgi:TonB family protein
MRAHRALLLAGLLLLRAAAWGQGDAKAAAKVAEAALKGVPMYLRGYSAEPVARFHVEGGALVADPARMHAYAIFTTKAIKLKGGKIVLTGERTAVPPTGIHAAPKPEPPEPLTIEVDLRGGDAAAILPKLQDGLFFADLEADLAGSPEWMAPAVYIMGGPRDTCRCTRASEDGQWRRLTGQRVTPPRLVHAADPEFSEEARRAKLSGNVMVAIHVGETGRVEDVWLLRGLGLGLDEKAMQAALQYEFQPAQYEGKPVGIMLNVEVNFQIF